MQLPETIIGTAFGLVVFPTLADLAVRHDRGGLRATLGETLRAVLALAVPAAAGLILLGRPLLQLLYQRGAFDAAATEAVSTALRYYALGLVGHCCLELAARAFFAEQDTVTPLIIAAGSAATNILLALLLMKPMGVAGLALANSLAVTAEVLVLLLVLRRRWGGLEGRRSLGTLARLIVAVAVMTGVVSAVLAAADSGGLGAPATLAVAGLAGLVSYVGVCWFLRVRELYMLPAVLLGRGA